MATTIGTEKTRENLLEDLVQLDYDAADAYQAAIDRLDETQFRDRLREFKGDHLRHISEIGEILERMGRTPPKQGDMKSLLTRGKVVIGGLMGDKAILQAMRTNEADTNTAYERAVKFHGLDADTRNTLERALEDERRHCQWILDELKTL
ncbi:MAG: ferritin-like domain-containing protein [Stellaceae bacterium]